LRAGADPADAVAGIVAAVEAVAPGSRLNLLLTDGAGIWATTWYHALSVRVSADAVLVASEPIDPFPEWTAVPDRHLVVAEAGRCSTQPLTTGVP
jgi:glutamine amidotransferase